MCDCDVLWLWSNPLEYWIQWTALLALKTFTHLMYNNSMYLFLKTLDDFLLISALLGDHLERRHNNVDAIFMPTNSILLFNWYLSFLTNKTLCKKTQFSNIHFWFFLIFQCWLSIERLIKSPIVTGNLFSVGNMPTRPG